MSNREPRPLKERHWFAFVCGTPMHEWSEAARQAEATTSFGNSIKRRTPEGLILFTTQPCTFYIPDASITSGPPPEAGVRVALSPMSRRPARNQYGKALQIGWNKDRAIRGRLGDRRVSFKHTNNHIKAIFQVSSPSSFFKENAAKGDEAWHEAPTDNNMNPKVRANFTSSLGSQN